MYKVNYIYYKYLNRTSLETCQSIPVVLSLEAKDALSRAPDVTDVEHSCQYWRSFFHKFKRDGLISLARTVFLDLSTMPDDDVKKARKYLVLADTLHDIENVQHRVLQHAMANRPRDEGDCVTSAEGVYARIERLADVLGELIYCRRDGANALVQNAQRGELTYRFP